MPDEFLEGDDEFIFDDSSDDEAFEKNDAKPDQTRNSNPHTIFPSLQGGKGGPLPSELMETHLVRNTKGDYLVASRTYVKERRLRELTEIHGFVGGIMCSARRDEDQGNLEILEAVLNKRHWDSDGVVQDLVDSPEKVFNEAGYSTDHLYDTPLNMKSQSTFECPILCTEVPWAESVALPGCNHRASKEAWRQWFQSRLYEASVLGLKCIFCTRPVPTAFVEALLSKTNMEQWNDRLTDAYVQNHPLARNCPGKDCAKVILLQTPVTRRYRSKQTSDQSDAKSVDYTLSMDCQCDCGERFCFACGYEGHLPIPCEIIQIWDRKNQGEADNVVWIFVNTKTCPACKNPIEKNQGCMHMTCRCRYEFCWLCMGDWKKHNGSDYYRCNVYEEEQAKHPANEAESERKRAADSLERYTHFYERYRAHMQGQRLAEETYERLKGKLCALVPEDKNSSSPSQSMEDDSPPKKVKKEGSFSADPPQIKNAEDDGYQVDPSLLSDNRFCERMLDALTQIIDGRRLLKFSYAFGYYADWKGIPQMKDLFEHQQGQLEWALDQISAQTEKFKFDQMVLPEGNWHDYNRDLLNITRVVRGFFNNMTQAFEADIVQVAAPATLPEDTTPVPRPVS
eukprot:Blabericola_migrator_1__990@NODE_1248_length_4986_cov_136_719658_g842_i0_p1_GENE_NODE_1248_length_4986_cov_136_719658_g842_i0NODE_1248_length_4986_cov_136_719658_g842_i0_p1_ORF_typecomplete_len623_score108_08IBR/PF01485_21/1_5e07IBR/PF01485_21/2_8e13PhoD/PF09423_10/2_3zfC3HC4_2/PF13923_6/2_2zfC3HC4_2/PF13923_6/9_9e02zfC3HC4_2/PF13923_6/24_NODE_1248_length_4986_cov_136_719658_g842_i030184886